MERIYDAPYTEIVTVTPEYAQELLANMAANRPLRSAKRAQYEDSMTSGQWFLTGQGLTIDWYGRLIDGEHRIRSVVETGVPCPMIILYGADPASRVAIDDGVKRKFSDDLVMTGTQDANQAAALLRRIVFWEEVAERNNGLGGLAQVSHYSRARTALNFTWPDKEKEVVAALKLANRVRPKWPGNSGALAFVAWLLRDENPVTVQRFFSVLADGSQDPEDRPLLQARQILTGNMSSWRKSRKDFGPEYEVYWMVKAWNAWLRRERVVRLSLGKGGLTNPFPKIIRTR